jgi:hypothetical protein
VCLGDRAGKLGRVRLAGLLEVATVVLGVCCCVDRGEVGERRI